MSSATETPTRAATPSLPPQPRRPPAPVLSAHLVAVSKAIERLDEPTAFVDGRAREAAPVLLEQCVLRELRLFAEHLVRCEERATKAGVPWAEATELLVRLRRIYQETLDLSRDVIGAGEMVDGLGLLPFGGDEPEGCP